MLRKRTLALELRVRANEAARKKAQRELQVMAVRFLVGLAVVVVLLVMAATDVFARSCRIEDANASQLEKILKANDNVAVFWYARKCKRCDSALEELESLAEDASKLGVLFVKVNDKRLAKSTGVAQFPALSFYQGGEPDIFHGDFGDEDEVLEFLTTETMLVIPDKIEEVSAEMLDFIIDTEKYVTALFYDSSKLSQSVVTELEQIDDEADVFRIRFVKVRDADGRMAKERFAFHTMPTLVYFRKRVPIVYHGDLMDEPEVLEWLIQHQTSADEEDLVEAVTATELDIMVRHVDNLLVLFHDDKKLSKQALQALENIDDDLDLLGASFVSVEDASAVQQHRLDSRRLPAVVLFRNQIPSLYPGQDVTDHDDVLWWARRAVSGADGRLEDVIAGDLLDGLIARESQIAVFFYRNQDQKVKQVLSKLTKVNLGLTAMNFEEKDRVLLVKTDDPAAAEDYGIDEDDLPRLLLFRHGVPKIYPNLDQDDHQRILSWMLREIGSERDLQVLTDSMLERLVSNQKSLAVFFYDRKNVDELTLSALATMDRVRRDSPNLTIVKTSDRDDADEYGVFSLPSLVLFNNAVPTIYPGEKLAEAKTVSSWLQEHLLEQS